MKMIYQSGAYRIIEREDDTYDFEDLCGELYDHTVNPDIPPEQLDREKAAFLELVETVGVFGYVLQRWNPAVGKGWEQVGACYGFVGPFDATEDQFNHYIVDEFKEQIGGAK